MRLILHFRLIYLVIKGIILPNNVKTPIQVGNTLFRLGAFKKSIEKITSLPGGKEFFANPKRPISN